MNSLKLTIIFEDAFYYGVFEKINGKSYQVAKVNLGSSDPKIYDIQRLVTFQLDKITFYSAKCVQTIVKHKNPKRLQRMAKKQVQGHYQGSKAQQAIQKQHEQIKNEKKKSIREIRVKQKQRKFELKKQKRYQKHRGH